MQKSADFIFENANVFTANPSQMFAEAVAITGNRISFVGQNKEARGYKGNHTRVIDMSGGTIMPGIIDSHYHMMYGALNMAGMQLDDVINFDELSKFILAYANKHPEATWLAGAGLRYNLGPNNTPLTRQHLDAIVADRPIYLNSFDGHTSWANTLALKMAGIFNGGKTAPNSENVLDEHGESTGELREPGAYQPVSDLVPKPDETGKRSLLKKALQLTASLGITSVHNMDGNYEQAARYAAFEDLEELTCRIYIPYSINPETTVDMLARDVAEMKQAFNGAMLRTGSVKLFIDGVIESFTGLLVDPYEDNPTIFGAPNYEIAHFNNLVAKADQLGMQVITHAVGDMAVRKVLDAYEYAQTQNGKRDSRHRVEHIELIHPDDLSRFKQLDVLASMQPLHSPMQLGDDNVWIQRVGTQRWKYSFAWRMLRDAGATLVFGSDWPIVTQNPFQGISNALTRAPWEAGLPEQNQTLIEALLSYTRDGAFGEFQENQKGQLQTNYLADLVALEENIFETSPEVIGKIMPVLTMANGKIVHEV